MDLLSDSPIPVPRSGKKRLRKPSEEPSSKKRSISQSTEKVASKPQPVKSKPPPPNEVVTIAVDGPGIVQSLTPVTRSFPEVSIPSLTRFDISVASANVLVMWQGAEDWLSAASEFVRGGVSRFHQMSGDLIASEARNFELSVEVSRLEDLVKDAKEEAKGERAAASAAVSEANRLRAELAECQKEKADLRASQGPLLRAFAERLFLSRRFSRLAGEVAGVLNQRVVSATLDKVVAAYPEVDKDSLGYADTPTDEIIASYAAVMAKVIADGVKSFPLVESLASSREVITPDLVRSCPVDRDPSIEAVLASLENEVDDEVVEEDSHQSQPEVEANQHRAEGAEVVVVGTESDVVPASGVGAEEASGGVS